MGGGVKDGKYVTWMYSTTDTVLYVLCIHLNEGGIEGIGSSTMTYDLPHHDKRQPSKCHTF